MTTQPRDTLLEYSHGTDSESKHALCCFFFRLNGKHAGNAGFHLEEQLREREDFVEHLALTAMDLCHKEAKRRDDRFKAQSLKFYEDAIIDALSSGKLPGQRNGGNGHRPGDDGGQEARPISASRARDLRWNDPEFRRRMDAIYDDLALNKYSCGDDWYLPANVAEREQLQEREWQKLMAERAGQEVVNG